MYGGTVVMDEFDSHDELVHYDDCDGDDIMTVEDIYRVIKVVDEDGEVKLFHTHSSDGRAPDYRKMRKVCCDVCYNAEKCLLLEREVRSSRSTKGRQICGRCNRYNKEEFDPECVMRCDRPCADPRFNKEPDPNRHENIVYMFEGPMFKETVINRCREAYDEERVRRALEAL